MNVILSKVGLHCWMWAYFFDWRQLFFFQCSSVKFSQCSLYWICHRLASQSLETGHCPQKKINAASAPSPSICCNLKPHWHSDSNSEIWTWSQNQSHFLVQNQIQLHIQIGFQMQVWNQKSRFKLEKQIWTHKTHMKTKLSIKCWCRFRAWQCT